MELNKKGEDWAQSDLVEVEDTARRLENFELGIANGEFSRCNVSLQLTPFHSNHCHLLLTPSRHEAPTIHEDSVISAFISSSVHPLSVSTVNQTDGRVQESLRRYHQNLHH